ncbi:MAG TPA: SDR family NAD(P)-dependent oxidoreductase [Gaiellaceae bacterium]|nr:SDR family NAD(P)-dependent oxidoreductase [Gaiellaceae bacterium]
MNSSDRKVAVVTGGARGIGRAVCERLAATGLQVVVDYPSEDDDGGATVAAIEAAGGSAVAIRADVSRKDEVDALFASVLERFGRVDVLVNNAGICPFSEFLEIDEELWDRVHAVNLKGAFLCSQAAARAMLARGEGGRIVSVSSISALVGGPLQVHYTPTKAGVRSLMQSLAIVLGPHGITCNSVLPGTIATDINAAFFEDAETLRRYEQGIPTGRLGSPADVAGAVAYLVSDEAAYVNGADILVDGGAFVTL